MIKSYLERDLQARVMARYAMHEAEQAFKAASKDYDTAEANIEEHLADLSEEMGYRPLHDPLDFTD